MSRSFYIFFYIWSWIIQDPHAHLCSATPPLQGCQVASVARIPLSFLSYPVFQSLAALVLPLLPFCHFCLWNAVNATLDLDFDLKVATKSPSNPLIPQQMKSSICCPSLAMISPAWERQLRDRPGDRCSVFHVKTDWCRPSWAPAPLILRSMWNNLLLLSGPHYL